ncbi:MAG: spondin domain-containing protein [Anaerolineae bacterium]|nr:spondin domain-containing protein [Anaerolineae bacterium]
MFIKRLVVAASLLTLPLLGSGVGAAAQTMSGANFTVRIENVSGQNTQVYSDIGIAGIPVNDTVRRAAMPSEAYEFTVKAVAGDRLSFAAMYGQSNDSFFGASDAGIALFDDRGKAISGDVSDQVVLWDAGTEVNEPLGTGANQGPRQSGPDAGEVENGVVQVVGVTDEFPAANTLLHVTLTPVTDTQIKVRIENTTGSAPVPTGISPVLYVVHTADQVAPLFKTGEKDRGLGLERIAESGNAEVLAPAIAGSAVMNVGASPGVFVITSGDQLAPIFKAGEKDRGQGLEAQAEDGNPTALSEALTSMSMSMSAAYKQVGVFNTPVGADKPGPLAPGAAFEFTFTAAPGDRLYFTEMFGQSNDLFFAPDENGIALFSGKGTPISGSITGLIQLWDAGTEVNQEPFVGADQAPRQIAPNTGAAENGVVLPIYAVTDGYHYPSVLSSLKVTITNDMGMTVNMMAMPTGNDAMMAEATPAK